MTSVETSGQNLVCNETGKKLVNESGILKIQSAGPEMVDLGLSVKWAKNNIGATNGDTAESWVGVSGKAAVTALKHGGIPVPAEIACDIMNGGKPGKCKPYDEYWYNRPIKNDKGETENHLKIMVGNPPGHESIEAPQELIDKLIQQAVEFGE